MRITPRWKDMAVGLTIAGIILLGALVSHYRDNYHQSLSKQHEFAQLAEERLNTITDMQVRQRDVAALDAKYTKELADAKQTIGDLRRDVESGVRRLRVRATCQKQSATASGTTDAASPRLAESAQRDYFTLIERLTQMEKQLGGLQEYVREQCLK